MIKVPTNTRLHDPNHKCYAPVVVIVTSLRTMPQSPADRALGMTRSSVCSYCFCSMGAHFPSPSTIPLLSTTYQHQEPRVSHHLWKQVTVEIDFSSVFYLINSYFSHDFLWFYLPIFTYCIQIMTDPASSNIDITIATFSKMYHKPMVFPINIKNFP